MIQNVKDRIIELGLVNKVRLDVLKTSNRSDSDSYIKRKRKVLEGIGIEFKVHDVTAKDLHDLIKFINEMNGDPKVNGILIQFPLGNLNIKSHDLMEMVDCKKDVDGFHPLNLITRTSGKCSTVNYTSCTPKAVMRLFKEMEIDLKGVDVVLIGKSRVVGMPLLHQLLSKGATVQVCHKSTINLPQKCQKAQILIVAAGHPHLVKSDWILPGAIVIDIGINHDAQGHLIGGDVDYEAVKEVAGYITPVPGGIGPLTIAALAENVLQSAIINFK